ncbi:conserved unknown protein [Ectocarpus siliculosus]|uniref:Pentacotripeptide-repeat region of PRORP domain-containing protein n=1 Tax=Ectocarpus siliculosus TaxID=2880 RepID=D8LDL3_ECTSI|nr:conserved unknown protein [Ectocarpus siliculosus]|eukprot:CBN74088.1 conserved unknown protein [Ectocarpus siliculosus]
MHRAQPLPRSSAVNVSPSTRRQARDISSTAPAWKGRRGGASALMPKRSGPVRRKIPGAGKKKKPKVHGAPMSRIHRDQRLEADGKAQMEAMKAISPEDRAKVQEMTEAFINTPLGAQDDSINAFLRRKDPDAMMLNLGMRLSDDDHAIAGGGSGEGNLPLSADCPSPSPLLHDGVVDATAAAAAPEPPPSRDTLPFPSPQPSSPWSREPSGMYSNSPAPPTPPYPYSLPSSMMPYGGEAGMGSPRGGGGGGGGGAAEEFSFLVRTLGAHGRFEEARSRVIPEMRRRGVTPTEHTFASLLAGTAIERDPIAAEQVWSEMVEGGIRPSAHAWCSRVNAHARAGRMRRALSLGKEMREQGHPWDVATYTSLIAGSTRKRNYSGAWGLWNDMVIWGVQPDAMAYNTMMKLCADTRQYERAMLFLDDMDMEGLRPSRITIETLLKAAATAPQWIRAYGTIVDDLVQRFIGLGVTPEVDTYRALLLAYSNGGDADKVLQCIEEVHVLEGHTADNLGDGTPRLPWQAYCDSLDAIARCTSVGRHRGTPARWGILPGQDSLVMDITSLEVPEEDFSRVREMQMAAMEWDEEGEAALKKGFRKGKRTKFRGVTTPDDLVGDDEYERAIASQYEQVMDKAKAMKEVERREALLQLGIDPDEGDKEAKTRPRVLPDPRDRERIEAPVPHWLSDGGSVREGWGGWEEEEDDVSGRESRRREHQSPEGTGDPAGRVSSRLSGRSGEEEGVFKKASMLDLLEGDQADGGVSGGEAKETGWSEDEDGRLVLPDNLEGMMEEVRALAQQDLDRRKNRHPHLRGKGDDDDDDDDWEEEEEEEEEEEDQWGLEEEEALGIEDVGATREEEQEEEFGFEDVGAKRDEPEVEANAAFEEMLAESRTQTLGADQEQEQEQIQRFGDDDGDEDTSSFLDGEEIADVEDIDSVHDGSSLIDQLDRLQTQQQDDEEAEEEYEDWTPLMHQGLKERTEALMGVVQLLEADGMAAARAADAEKGFRVGGEGGAGPAVRRMLRSRLKTLTESRRCKEAIKFVDEEYPKEGAKVDAEGVLQVVEMYVNTRGVGLAEAFVQRWTEENGVKPNRRHGAESIFKGRTKSPSARFVQVNNPNLECWTLFSRVSA